MSRGFFKQFLPPVNSVKKLHLFYSNLLLEFFSLLQYIRPTKNSNKGKKQP